MNIASDVRRALQGEITSPESGVFSGEFYFDAGHPVFAGHFPQYALLPGVYLLQSLALVLGDSAGPVVNVRSVKFQAQVRPACRYQAVVKIQKKENGSMVRGEVLHEGVVAALAVFETRDARP